MTNRCLYVKTTKTNIRMGFVITYSSQ